MSATMDVGVFVFVVVLQTIDDLLGPLGGGTIVQPDQGITVDLL